MKSSAASLSSPSPGTPGEGQGEGPGNLRIAICDLRLQPNQIANRKSQIKNLLIQLLAVAIMLLFAQSAYAHTEVGKAAGFANGFKHPWSGWDHILAMVAVGLWGAQLGAPAVWLLPVIFPMVMSIGGFMGLIGIRLPGVEIGIALSAVLLGAMVLGEVRSKHKAFLIFAAALVGMFGLFHGHAHGTEMDKDESALLYSVGFVIATGTLHACGISIGLIHHWPAGKIVLRVAGAVIVIGGLYFLREALHGAPAAPAAQAALSLLSNLKGTL